MKVRCLAIFGDRMADTREFDWPEGLSLPEKDDKICLPEGDFKLTTKHFYPLAHHEAEPMLHLTLSLIPGYGRPNAVA